MTTPATIVNAASRRTSLSKAVADWRATANRDEADINFEIALITIGIIKSDDIVESFYWDANSPADQGVTIITAVECIYIDTHGNTTRGAAE